VTTEQGGVSDQQDRLAVLPLSRDESSGMLHDLRVAGWSDEFIARVEATIEAAGVTAPPAEPPSDDVERVRIAAALWDHLPHDDVSRQIVRDVLGVEDVDALAAGVTAPPAEPRPVGGEGLTDAIPSLRFAQPAEPPDDFGAARAEHHPQSFAARDACEECTSAIRAARAEPRAEGLRETVLGVLRYSVDEREHTEQIADDIVTALATTPPQRADLALALAGEIEDMAPWMDKNEVRVWSERLAGVVKP
jgi:hypothetical protein